MPRSQPPKTSVASFWRFTACRAPGYRPRPGRSRRALECPIQRFEHGPSLLEKGMVIGIERLQAIHQRADGAGLRRAEACIFEVQIVDDRCNPIDGGVPDTEDVHERLECALFATMRELHPKHVEGDRVSGGGRLLDESETRLAVDETLDQPGTSHPIDARTRSGYPCP